MRRMTWMESHAEIGTTALFAGSVDDRVEAVLEVRADRRDHVTARRKTEHSDLVRIEAETSTPFSPA